MEPLAEKIRSHQDETGVDMAGVQYKTSLFADDVILTLSNSERSLPSVTALLELYGSLTYYKVNTSKSLILDLFVNPRIKQTLMSKFPYSLSKSATFHTSVSYYTKNHQS